MKKNWIKVLVLGLVVVFTFSAFAEDADCTGEGHGRKKHGSGRNGKAPEFLKKLDFDKLDQDGDGVLSKEEFDPVGKLVKHNTMILQKIKEVVNGKGGGKHQKVFKEYALKKYDLNKNGELDPEEQDVIKKDREEMKNKYDVDSDGKLNREERIEFMKAMKDLLGIPDDALPQRGKGRGKNEEI